MKRQSRTNSAQLELACCPRSARTPTRLMQPPVSKESARFSRIMLLAGCGRESHRGPLAAYIFKVLRLDHQTTASQHCVYATSSLSCNGHRMDERCGAVQAPSVRNAVTFSTRPCTSTHLGPLHNLHRLTNQYTRAGSAAQQRGPGAVQLWCSPTSVRSCRARAARAVVPRAACLKLSQAHK